MIGASILKTTRTHNKQICYTSTRTIMYLLHGGLCDVSFVTKPKNSYSPLSSVRASQYVESAISACVHVTSVATKDEPVVFIATLIALASSSDFGPLNVSAAVVCHDLTCNRSDLCVSSRPNWLKLAGSKNVGTINQARLVPLWASTSLPVDSTDVTPLSLTFAPVKC